MKVLLVITLTDTGGAQTHVATLAAALPVGTELTLATGGPGPLTERLAGAVPVRYLDGLCREVAPLRDLRALASFRALIRELQPDLVHLHSSKAGFLGRLAARHLGVPAVYTVHGWAFLNRGSPLGSAPAWWLERAGARLGGEIICVAESDLEVARRTGLAPKQRLHHVPNGLPDLVARPAPDLAGLPRPVALWVGRLDPPKDPVLAVTAFRAAGEPGSLVIVGAGRLEARARAAAGDSPRIFFLGQRRDVPELLAAADLFVLTSRSEALPITLIEALRAGRPALASEVGDLGRVLARTRAGWSVPPGRGSELAATWKRLAASPAELTEAGARGREAFLRHYTVERMVEGVLHVYEVARGRT